MVNFREMKHGDVFYLKATVFAEDHDFWAYGFIPMVFVGLDDDGVLVVQKSVGDIVFSLPFEIQNDSFLEFPGYDEALNLCPSCGMAILEDDGKCPQDSSNCEKAAIDNEMRKKEARRQQYLSLKDEFENA